jgi:hypothetical protein
MANDLEPRRSGGTLQAMDNALLVVVAVIGVLIVLKIVGFIAGTIFFLVKVGIAAAIVFAALHFFLRAKRT